MEGSKDRFSRNLVVVALPKGSYCSYTSNVEVVSPQIAFGLSIFHLTIFGMSFPPHGHKMAAKPPDITKFQAGCLRAEGKRCTSTEFISFPKAFYLIVQN